MGFGISFPHLNVAKAQRILVQYFIFIIIKWSTLTTFPNTLRKCSLRYNIRDLMGWPLYRIDCRRFKNGDATFKKIRHPPILIHLKLSFLRGLYNYPPLSMSEAGSEEASFAAVVYLKAGSILCRVVQWLQLFFLLLNVMSAKTWFPSECNQ